MAESTSHESPRILVVDDKAFVRAMVGRVLESAGILSTEFATNGREALSLIRRAEPHIDIVMCDLLMPDMDGVEVVRYVAELPDKPAFVFVSGQSPSLLTTAVDMAKARGLNVLGAIEKPVSVEAVREVLSKFGGNVGARPSRRLANAIALLPSDLKEALAADQVVLHFQPKVDLRSRMVIGYESLVRWQHPQHGLVPPGQFITLAEQSGLIGPLTDRVMQLALQQCSVWNALGHKTKVSVNISAHMLVDLGLPDRISREADQFRVAPSQIVLEITETGVVQDAGDTLDILARLHMKGFPLSIDDFGTGYSSMDQLRRVPFAELKIDRAFVHGAASNHKARAILESSATLARKLGMSLVAEGAEDKADWDVLSEADVDSVQGFYVARPMPPAEVPRWSSKWHDGVRPRAGVTH